MYVCVREKRIGVAAKNRQWGESFLKKHLFYEASFSQLIKIFAKEPTYQKEIIEFL